MDGYLGQIMAWGPNFAPRNWAFCNGQLMSINANPALYSLLGTMYGGDGRSTFGVPNLQGRVAMGAGNGVGLTPRRQGEYGGQETVQLSIAEMPAHTHAATSTPAGGSSAELPLSTTAGVNATPEAGDVPAAASDDIYGPNSSTVSTPLNVNVAPQDVTVGTAGGSLPHNNIQPYQVVNYIICTEGLYPSRS